MGDRNWSMANSRPKIRQFCGDFSPGQNYKSEIFKKIKKLWKVSSGGDLLTGVKLSHCERLGHWLCPFQLQIDLKGDFKSLEKNEPKEDLFRPSMADKRRSASYLTHG